MTIFLIVNRTQQGNTMNYKLYCVMKIMSTNATNENSRNHLFILFVSLIDVNNYLFF
jgi:hypothetical protein